MEQLKIIISGGGTGGHIFPAIAIANGIKHKYPDANILFVGAKGRMEMEKVPVAGYKIIGLEVAGFDRKRIWRNINVIWKLRKSLTKAKNILKEFKPQIVIGVGGYASGPTLQAANKLKIPTLIHEANSYAGVTNRLLAAKANKICVAYNDMDRFFPKNKIILTGNPCRENLLNNTITTDEAREFFHLSSHKKTLLIIGGSLGSRTLNLSVEKYINNLPDNIQIIWQCGKIYYKQIKSDLENKINKNNLYINDFINRMDMAYKAADLVISRAGASSISELCLLSKPVILVPSPNVAEDHQTKNAMSLVKKNAAILISDKNAIESLMPTAFNIINDDNQLMSLAENIYKLAQHNSVERIVNEIETIIKSA